MTLTSGHGPLTANRSGRFTAPVPDGVAYVEPFRRRVTATVDGDTVVDSERAVLVHRPGGAPVWAFPSDEVGTPAAVACPEADGFVEVPWDAVDAWFQEGHEVLLHAPNPYHRVDYLPTTRRLTVSIGDAVLVDTTDTVAVYETALEPRLYVIRDHVRMDLLEPSDTTTVCPYKGVASYWSARIGDEVVADVAWSYDDALPEAAAIAGLLSFYGQRATVVADLPTPDPS